MYPAVLILHSLVRWLVLTTLIISIPRAYYGWLLDKKFSNFDNSIRHWTATTAHIQLTLGLCLYSLSPLIDYFLNSYDKAVHIREIRFFAMEHSVMMITAVLLITIGSIKAKRRETSRQKFKTMAIWFSIGLLIILASIPWPFSPFADRPYFRLF
jgi:hypothetical protein